MNSSLLDRYILTAKGMNGSTPAMMDESTIFLFITSMSGMHITSYDELIEANISNISVYDIPEDKKEFNIETVRGCIIDIELKPYEGKNIFILRHFSTATLSAQNALLKILEECPEYAIIILEVENPHSVIETIRSRVIDLTRMRVGVYMSLIGSEIVEHYQKKEYKKLAKALHDFKCSSDEAILILQGVISLLSQEDILRCEMAIESLSTTHENPRSILDMFFL